MSWRISAWFVLLLAGASPARAQGDALAEQGKKVFIDQGCYGCHMIGLIGTPIGPDLSHVGAKYSASRPASWLPDPSAQKPTAQMPRISLTGAEVRAAHGIPDVDRVNAAAGAPEERRRSPTLPEVYA